MDNQERILHILTEMQQDMQDLKRRMTTFEDSLEVQTVSINLNIENNIGKRLDALFDGYMLGSEKHELLERRVDIVEERVDRLVIAAS